jgi:hypothetical protein
MPEDEVEVIRIDELRRAHEELVERLQHWTVKKSVPDTSRERDRVELGELLALAQSLAAALDELERRQAAERQVGEFFDGMKNVLEAINANMKTTSELLLSSEARLVGIEKSVGGRTTDAEVDSEVLAEGKYLSEQLRGLAGTEGRSPFFKDTAPSATPSGAAP